MNNLRTMVRARTHYEVTRRHVPAIRLAAVPSRGERGFTMIEVLVAGGIFMIGLVGVIALNLTAAINTRVSSDISLSSNIAASTVERARIADFATLADAVESYDEFGFSVPNGDTEVHFVATTIITPGAGGLFSDVDVSVGWTYAPNPHEHIIRLKSRVSE